MIWTLPRQGIILIRIYFIFTGILIQPSLSSSQTNCKRINLCSNGCGLQSRIGARDCTRGGNIPVTWHHDRHPGSEEQQSSANAPTHVRYPLSIELYTFRRIRKLTLVRFVSDLVRRMGVRCDIITEITRNLAKLKRHCTRVPSIRIAKTMEEPYIGSISMLSSRNSVEARLVRCTWLLIIMASNM